MVRRMTVSDEPVCVVVGSVNEDCTVELPRLPSSGETVIGGRSRSGVGGKGANQAVVAAGLGARVYMVGQVGQDVAGASARAGLAEAGIDDRFLRDDPAEPTGRAVVLVDAAGENMIGVAQGANSTLSGDTVTTAVEEIGRGVGRAVLLVSLEIPLDAVLAACAAARQRGWPVIVNPAPASPLPGHLMRSVDVLTPNSVEVEQISTEGPAGLLRAGAGAVIVTMGSRGAQLWTDSHAPVHVPALPVVAVDTTGCGDAFNGALGWALATGRSIGSALTYAMAAGALAATVRGAQAPVTRADVEALLQLHDGAPRP